MNGRLLFNKRDGKPVPYTIFMLIVGAGSARPKYLDDPFKNRVTAFYAYK